MRLDIDPVCYRAMALRQWGYDVSDRAARRFQIEHEGDTIALSPDGLYALLTLYMPRESEFPRTWRIPMTYYLDNQATSYELLCAVLRDVERYGIPEDAERVYE